MAGRVGASSSHRRPVEQVDLQFSLVGGEEEMLGTLRRSVWLSGMVREEGAVVAWRYFLDQSRALMLAAEQMEQL